MPYSFIFFTVILIYLIIFKTKSKSGLFIMPFAGLLLISYFTGNIVSESHFNINIIVFFVIFVFIFVFAFKLEISKITLALASCFFGLLNYQAIVQFDLIYASTFNSVIMFTTAFFVCLPFIFNSKAYLFCLFSFFAYVEIYNAIFLIQKINYATIFDYNFLNILAFNLSAFLILFLTFEIAKSFIPKKNKKYPLNI